MNRLGGIKLTDNITEDTGYEKEDVDQIVKIHGEDCLLFGQLTTFI